MPEGEYDPHGSGEGADADEIMGGKGVVLPVDVETELDKELGLLASQTGEFFTSFKGKGGLSLLLLVLFRFPPGLGGCEHSNRDSLALLYLPPLSPLPYSLPIPSPYLSESILFSFCVRKKTKRRI